MLVWDCSHVGTTGGKEAYERDAIKELNMQNPHDCRFENESVSHHGNM